MNEQEMDNKAGTEGQDIPETAQETGTNTTEISEADKLRNELKDSKDQYLRLVAEFDNFRKRTAKERQELVQTAAKDLVQALLVVLDDSDRAFKTMETATDIEAVREGMRLVWSKLDTILGQKGLKAMEPQEGREFDPELHEAITEVPAPSEELQGKVVDVVEKGYYLNDKLIRYAKVVVGK